MTRVLLVLSIGLVGLVGANVLKGVRANAFADRSGTALVGKPEPVPVSALRATIGFRGDVR